MHPHCQDSQLHYQHGFCRHESVTLEGSRFGPEDHCTSRLLHLCAWDRFPLAAGAFRVPPGQSWKTRVGGRMATVVESATLLSISQPKRTTLLHEITHEIAHEITPSISIPGHWCGAPGSEKCPQASPEGPATEA